MQNIVRFVFVTVTVFGLLIACENESYSPQTPPVIVAKKDSAKKDSIAPVEIPSPEKNLPRTINKDLDDVARYIAGLNITSDSKLDKQLLKNQQWKSYSIVLNKNWDRVEKNKINKMKVWAEKELSSLNTNILFYPFAGADMLNAYTLFPKAKQFILVGLEPVGTLPDLKKISETDSLGFYFGTLNKSLSSILNFSFFRTKSMAVDLNREDVNGTLQIILLFLERTGNGIIDIKPVAVNYRGELISYSSFEQAQKDTLKNHGVKIDFLSADTTEHSVIYFSINLANQPFARNTSFKTFVKKSGADVTYLKSASYLMHKRYFSEIRSLILENSRAVLQDDSGIPWKFFNNGKYTTTLYGHYTGVIPLFAKNVQSDLDSIYKVDSIAKKVKPLPFGIGYKYKEGVSNLMLSIKK